MIIVETLVGWLVRRSVTKKGEKLHLFLQGILDGRGGHDAVPGHWMLGAQRPPKVHRREPP